MTGVSKIDCMPDFELDPPNCWQPRNARLLYKLDACLKIRDLGTALGSSAAVAVIEVSHTKRLDELNV